MITTVNGMPCTTVTRQPTYEESQQWEQWEYEVAALEASKRERDRQEAARIIRRERDRYVKDVQQAQEKKWNEQEVARYKRTVARREAIAKRLEESESAAENDLSTGKGWANKSIPKKGWTVTSCWDSKGEGDVDGPLTESCMVCNTSIRYVFTVHNPGYTEEITVGCCCAAIMSGESEECLERYQQDLKSIGTSKAGWLSRNWRTAENGNEFLIIKGRRLVVFSGLDGWGWIIDCPDWIVKRVYSHFAYETSNRAKFALFDEVANRKWRK